MIGFHKGISYKERQQIAKIGFILMITCGIPTWGLIFLGIHIQGQRQIKRSVIVERQIDVTQRTLDGSYGYVKDWMYIGRDSILNTNATLIGDPEHPQSWENFYKYNPDYQYRLGNLSFPYELSKVAGSDTIVVHKDGDMLEFLLYTTES